MADTEDIDLELISLEEDCVSNDDCVENSNLLLLGRNLGLQDVEGQRVLQVIVNLMILSFMMVSSVVECLLKH